MPKGCVNTLSHKLPDCCPSLLATLVAVDVKDINNNIQIIPIISTVANINNILNGSRPFISSF
jgi:hypothetical protein